MPFFKKAPIFAVFLHFYASQFLIFQFTISPNFTTDCTLFQLFLRADPTADGFNLLNSVFLRSFYSICLSQLLRQSLSAQPDHLLLCSNLSNKITFSALCFNSFTSSSAPDDCPTLFSSNTLAMTFNFYKPLTVLMLSNDADPVLASIYHSRSPTFWSVQVTRLSTLFTWITALKPLHALTPTCLHCLLFSFYVSNKRFLLLTGKWRIEKRPFLAPEKTEYFRKL